MELLNRYCLALDLKNDPALIAEYEAHHQAVWPEIKKSILDAGIRHMEIFRIENRLFMIMETDAGFSFEAKAAADENNSKVQEWETLMWTFQKALPHAAPGQKWLPMAKIFDLDEQHGTV